MYANFDTDSLKRLLLTMDMSPDIRLSIERELRERENRQIDQLRAILAEPRQRVQDVSEELKAWLLRLKEAAADRVEGFAFVREE